MSRFGNLGYKEFGLMEILWDEGACINNRDFNPSKDASKQICALCVVKDVCQVSSIVNGYAGSGEISGISLLSPPQERAIRMKVNDRAWLEHFVLMETSKHAGRKLAASTDAIAGDTGQGSGR